MEEINEELVEQQTKLLDLWLKNTDNHPSWFPDNIEEFFDMTIIERRTIMWEFILLFGNNDQKNTVRLQLLEGSSFIRPKGNV